MKLKFADYTKQIKGSTVLNEVNICMKGGCIYGLRGSNGSGKTMLLRAACGLIMPSSGMVEIDDVQLSGFPQDVGILIEEPDFIGRYTGYENLRSIARIRRVVGPVQIREALREIGLDPDDSRPYRKYSLGMRKRLGIACALMENPELILLDEPFNGLDENGVSLAKKAIRKRADAGALCVVACHDRGILEEIADEIYEIENGRVKH